MSTATQECVATCAVCGRTQKARPAKAGGVKTPRGWKKVADGLRCRECTRSAMFARSVRTRIVAVEDDKGRDAKAFYQALYAASNDAAAFANWYIQQLYKADEGTLPIARDGKLPACPQVDFYGQATRLFPRLAPTSICSLAQMVRGWYAADRFACLLLKNRMVRTFKTLELPIPVHVQSWRFDGEAGGGIAIKAQIGPGHSWRFIVRTDGSELGRLKSLIAGDGERGAAMFVKRRRAKRPGESTPPPKVWQFRIAGLFPRRAPRQSHQEVTLRLGFDAGMLLFGALEDSDDVYELYGCDAKKIIVGGDRSDRIRQVDASKMRGLWSRRKVRRWQADRTIACERRAKKLGKLIELYAADLARWCRSHGVTAVDFDATDRGFMPHFPYAQLRGRIACALENIGIALHVLDADGEPLAEQRKQEALVGPGSETNGKARPPVTSPQAPPDSSGESTP